MTEQAIIADQLVTDPGPLSGAENMRRDEALLTDVVGGAGHATIRIYRWEEPTVSLGYFQDAADSIDPRIADCPRVRRLTGGGAILHDREVTYSCVIPAGHPLSRAPLQLYHFIHDEVIEVLSDCGVKASLRGEALATAGAEPGLCFLRQDPRDIVFAGRKVVGSAQRRRKGAILQHGSILLKASELIPEVQGLEDLAQGFDSARFLDKIGARLLRKVVAAGDAAVGGAAGAGVTAEVLVPRDGRQ